jgi:hypothetical protein
VPDLTPVITRIMDVVNVETTVAPAGNTVRAGTEVTNYTPRARVLEVFVEMPPELVPEATYAQAPEGTDAELGRAWWTLEKLLPSGKATIEVTFPKGTEVESSDLSWYIAGVDEAHLLGAEPLPGDWDVRLPRAVIEAAEAGLEPLPGTEEAEVDYDAEEGGARVEDDEG